MFCLPLFYLLTPTEKELHFQRCWQHGIDSTSDPNSQALLKVSCTSMCWSCCRRKRKPPAFVPATLDPWSAGRSGLVCCIFDGKREFTYTLIILAPDLLSKVSEWGDDLWIHPVCQCVKMLFFIPKLTGSWVLSDRQDVYLCSCKIKTSSSHSLGPFFCWDNVTVFWTCVSVELLSAVSGILVWSVSVWRIREKF